MNLGTTRTANTALEFSEEQAMILASAEEFCRANSGIDAVRAQLISAHDRAHPGYDPAVWQELVELGWLGVIIPEAHGGSDLGLDTCVCIAEAMGRSLLATPFFSCTLAAEALLRSGNDSQQRTWLPQIAAGAIGTLALLDSEDWGDNLTRCTATRDGDKLSLDGVKTQVCDAGVADFFIVAVALQDGGVAERPAFVVVSADELRPEAIRPQTLVDETKRASLVDFTDVTVVPAALLDSADALSLRRELLLIGALLAAAEATGSAAAALDCTVEYLRTRKQFGRPIGSYQALKHPAVEILTSINAARSLIYHAATLMADGTLDTDAEIACRMAKVQASDALLFVGDRAVQFHGAMGFTHACDAQLYLRRALWSQQVFGDPMHHRKRLAALLLDEC